jgi:hypothetical protein
MYLGTNAINNVYLGTNVISTVYLGTNQIYRDPSYLFLDDYGGSSGAYSLRKLRTAYIGSAIRVRRSSDSTEQDIGFVSNVLDTASLETFCSGTDGFVTTWYNQGVSGSNLVQTTSVSQPKIVSSGTTITENGKPTIQFDGSNDWLDVTITKPARFSVFSVLKLANNTTRYGVMGALNSTGSTSTTWGSLDARTTSKMQTSWGDDTNSGTYESTSAITTTTQNLFTILYDSGLNIYMYKDNVSVPLTALWTTATTSAGTTYKFSVGRWGEYNGIYLSGNVQEVIIYSTYEGTNRSGMNSNINSFYGIY